MKTITKLLIILTTLAISLSCALVGAQAEPAYSEAPGSIPTNGDQIPVP